MFPLTLSSKTSPPLYQVSGKVDFDEPWGRLIDLVESRQDWFSSFNCMYGATSAKRESTNWVEGIIVKRFYREILIKKFEKDSFTQNYGFS